MVNLEMGWSDGSGDGVSLNQSRLEYIDAAVGIIIIFCKPEHVRVEEIDFPEWRKWIIDDLQS